jgi:Protein of unknown function (DUF2764)
MADLYPYVIASLPMLHFGMRPPFSHERFLEMCHRFIPDEDYRLLSTLPEPGEYPGTGSGHRAIRRWIEFDTALRNELVRIRAGRLHRGPGPDLRPEGYRDSSLGPAVMAAAMQASPLQAERDLDEMRWKALEDLGRGHPFDLDVLIAYACQLRILQRWEHIRSGDGAALLEQVLPK